MANKADILDIFEFLTTVYPPGQKQEETFNRHLPGLASVWLRSFADTPAPVLRRAAELYMAKGVFFPKPAEILALLPEADRQVAHEEEQAATDQINAGIEAEESALMAIVRPLRKRLRDLEDAYWQRGEFDCDAWEKLIADYESIGWTECAGGCRQRVAQFQSELSAVAIPAAQEIAA